MSNQPATDLQETLRPLMSLIHKSEKAQQKSGLKFAPGTSQHTLARNRLAALRLAHASTKLALDSHKP